MKTARRVFYDRMTSTEPWEKTASEKSSFSSNTNNFSARRCLESGGHSNQCISDAKSKDFLYKTNNISEFFMVLLQKSSKSVSHFKGKMNFYSRSSCEPRLMSCASELLYERSGFENQYVSTRFAWNFQKFPELGPSFRQRHHNYVSWPRFTKA